MYMYIHVYALSSNFLSAVKRVFVTFLCVGEGATPGLTFQYGST